MALIDKAADILTGLLTCCELGLAQRQSKA